MAVTGKAEWDIRDKVDEAIALDMKIKKDSKTLDRLKAELQAEAIAQIENKNIKYVEYHGSMGSCNVGYKEKLEISNFNLLELLLGDVALDKVKREESIKLSPDAKFKSAMIIVYKGEYAKHDIDSILRGIGLDEKQCKVARKKLKGDYFKDRKILESLGVSGDLEEELDAIREQLNYELASKFFDLEAIDLEQFKRTIFVEEGLSVGLDYEND